MSHRTLNAETPEEVASDIRKALQYVSVENLVVTSDCGFGRQGANRLVAFYKSAAAAQGANIVRREHGLPATYVPCADPQLSQDLVPPAFEEVGSSGAREIVASERVAPKLHSRSSGLRSRIRRHWTARPSAGAALFGPFARATLSIRHIVVRGYTPRHEPLWPSRGRSFRNEACVETFRRALKLCQGVAAGRGK